ncbi:hypothetical protein ACFQ9X_24315 [Catenulispora yoronensis]
MTGYVLRRLVGAAIVLLALSAIVYGLFTPGRPTRRCWPAARAARRTGWRW